MLTGGINGFYQIVQELMKNVRIFITTSRARSKILSELGAASCSFVLPFSLVEMLI